MASLAGKADPTIVNAAYRASMANVPGDHSKYYKVIADTHKELMDDIGKSFKSFELNKALNIAELDAVMAKFNDPLSVQSIDSDYHAMQDEIAALRQEWEDNRGFKGDTKGRQDWDRKGQQLIGRYQQNVNDLQGALRTWESGGVWKEGMHLNDITFAKNLAIYGINADLKSGEFNNRANSYMIRNPDATPEELWSSLGDMPAGTVVKYKDPNTGEYTYISSVGYSAEPSKKFPGLLPSGEKVIVAKKSSELKEMFPPKEIEGHADVYEMYNQVQKSGLGSKLSYEKFENDYKNQLDLLVRGVLDRNPNGLQYLNKQKVGGQKYSLKEALQNPESDIGQQILVSLYDLKPGLDTSGDGKITIGADGDYATRDSYNAMVESILSGEVDKDLSKNLYIDYTSKTAFKPAHERGMAEPDVDGVNGDDDDLLTGDLGIADWTYPEFGNGKINWTSARTLKRKLLNGTAFDFDSDGDGEQETYDFINGKWYQNWENEDNTGTEIGSADNMVLDIFKTNHEAFQGLTTTAVSVEDEIGETGLKPAEAQKKEIDKALNIKGDDKVSTKLNSIFGGLNKSSDMMFVPYSSDIGTNVYVFGVSDRAWSNDVTLIDPATKDFILDENDDPYRFSTGDNFNSKDIQKILNALGRTALPTSTTSGGGSASGGTAR